LDRLVFDFLDFRVVDFLRRLAPPADLMKAAYGLPARTLDMATAAAKSLMVPSSKNFRPPTLPDFENAANICGILISR